MELLRASCRAHHLDGRLPLDLQGSDRPSRGPDRRAAAGGDGPSGPHGDHAGACGSDCGSGGSAMSTLPDFGLALPELVLGGLTLALLMVGVYGKDRSTGLVSALSVVACIIAGILVLMTDTVPRATTFESLFVVDGFAAF